MQYTRLASSSACHIQEFAVFQNMVGFTTPVVSLRGFYWSAFLSESPGCVDVIALAKKKIICLGGLTY